MRWCLTSVASSPWARPWNGSKESYMLVAKWFVVPANALSISNPVWCCNSWEVRSLAVFQCKGPWWMCWSSDVGKIFVGWWNGWSEFCEMNGPQRCLVYRCAWWFTRNAWCRRLLGEWMRALLRREQRWENKKGVRKKIPGAKTTKLFCESDLSNFLLKNIIFWVFMVFLTWNSPMFVLVTQVTRCHQHQTALCHQASTAGAAEPGPSGLSGQQLLDDLRDIEVIHPGAMTWAELS